MVVSPGGVHCIDEGCYIMDGHCVRTIHAEANALLQCAKFGVPTDGAEMYVTHFPCLQCCKQIIQSGMKAVYYATDYKNHPYALSLFEDAGVETKKVELTELSIDANYQDKDAYVKRLLAELERQTTNQEKFQALQTEAESLFRL